MTFLHPWAIAFGAAAAALPVLVHWLTRPRPVRLPLSTVRFVRQAVQQRRSRHRLRDWLVLALRTLAVLLLAWAVARPLAGGGEPQAPRDEPGDASRVLILDVSQSMAAQAGGIQVFERARPLAARYLSDQAGIRANLILAGAGASAVFERLSANFAALREELARARPRPERLNVQAALNASADMLARAGGADGRRRELVVISDFQRSNWVSADFSVLPEDTRIELESVAPKAAPANLAVLRVGSQGRAEAGREVQLQAEVGNFSSTPRQVEVELTLGESAYRLQGLVPAGGKSILSTEIVPRGAGWQAGEARLLNVADALATDNARPFVLEVRAAPTYALVTRQPANVSASSSYYLERALDPLGSRPGPSRSRVLRLAPARVDREALAPAEVVVLDHPGRLSHEVIRLLATLVRRGRGLVYVAAEPTDAANLKLLDEAAGSDLNLPVDFVPPPLAERRRGLFLTEIRRERAPFQVFGDSLPALAGPLRFSGGLMSHRREGGLADDVLASYSDGSACVIVSSCGAGTVAVLNADLAACNLPSSPAFVPLVGELLDCCLARRGATAGIACGEPAVAYLPAVAGSAAGLRIVGPGGVADTGVLVEESTGVLWRIPAVEAPGVYRVEREGVTVFALAAAVPPEESDLRSLEPAVFRDRLAGGRTLIYRAAADEAEERQDLWVWPAVACILCLLGELVALKAFGT